MLTEKLEAINVALTMLAGHVSPESWENIRIIKAEIRDAIEIAAHLEAQDMIPPLAFEPRIPSEVSHE